MKISAGIYALFVSVLVTSCFALIGTWLWNWLAPIYFSFLPAVWQSIPFAEALGLVGLTWIVVALVPVFRVGKK